MALRHACAATLVLATAVSAARAELAPCEPDDAGALAAALARIERSVDPCGQSPDVAAVLEAVRRCRTRSYRICARAGVARNELERPVDPHGAPLPRTISWDPQLRTELERTRGQRGTRVMRDPTASLLHELAHAADDCNGRNPGEHELEAVSVENVYRRAAGLPQRTAYGDVPLPPQLVRECIPGRCPCSAPARRPTPASVRERRAAGRRAM